MVSYSDQHSTKVSKSHFKITIKLELIDGRWYFPKPADDAKKILEEIESLVFPAYQLLSGITPLISKASDITEFKKMIDPLLEKYEAKIHF